MVASGDGFVVFQKSSSARNVPGEVPGALRQRDSEPAGGSLDKARTLDRFLATKACLGYGVGSGGNREPRAHPGLKGQFKPFSTCQLGDHCPKMVGPSYRGPILPS